MEKHGRHKILFLVQLPPPLHGASQMNLYIKESKRINREFETSYLPLNFVNRLDQIGKFSFSKVLKMLIFPFSLLVRMFMFRPNIVYYTLAPFGGAFYRDSLFINIIGLFKCKIVVHLHGKGINEELRSGIKRAVYLRTFKYFDGVILLSDLLRYDIEKVYTGRVFIVPNGIPDQEISIIDEVSKNNNDETQLIYLSNLVKSKGVLEFVKALEILKSKSLPFKAYIVGGGADINIEDLRKKVKKKFPDGSVAVLGPKYGQEKIDILHTSDVFVFPTYFKNECFPLSILEAMKMGNAIISTDNGAIKDIIDGCGLIVKQRDSDSLSEAIEILLNDDKLREDYKVLSKEKFKKHFTISMFEDNLINVFNKL